MLDNDFMMGELRANVQSLTKTTDQLSRDLTGLRRDLQEINLFKSKVVGASLAISTLASLAVSLLSRHL